MNNRKYYPSITKYEIEKINSISEKLQNICLNLNCALEEYCAMLLYIDK